MLRVGNTTACSAERAETAMELYLNYSHRIPIVLVKIIKFM